MPIYEYKCLDCGAHIEKMQKVSDAPLKICEKCGGNLEKQLSLAGFQFKGEGWYVTDYAGKKEKSEKSDATEKAEKISSGESTAKSDAASNERSDKTSVSSKETASKKD